jgi:hypothetical protein
MHPDHRVGQIANELHHLGDPFSLARYRWSRAPVYFRG